MAIDPTVYDEVRRDRDRWRKEAGWLRHVLNHLNDELIAARRGGRVPEPVQIHSHKRQEAEVAFQSVVSRHGNRVTNGV